MNHERIIKKVPGDIHPLKRDSQGYIECLGDKEKIELQDLLERQNKILENKSFVSKLPDKGEKITKFRDKVKQELTRRNEIEDAAMLLSRLNIAAEGKAAMNEMEWTGKYEERGANKIVELDSDDETDPLKILAQPTGSGVHKKKIIIVPAEKPLINEEDLKEIESFKTEESSSLDHVKYITDKIEKINDAKDDTKKPFKEFKTTKTDVHDPAKEKLRKKDKYWEITAATPPLIVHGAIKSLNLNESLRLQTEQAEKLQEIQAKHAIERLTQGFGSYNIDSKRGDSDSSDLDDEEHEVHDDEDNDKAGTVVFPVDSTHE